jgi:hypothetical protein
MNRWALLWRAGDGFGAVALTALLAEGGFFGPSARAAAAGGAS